MKIEFLFGLVDILTLILMVLETLVLVSKMRKKENFSEENYKIVCFTWILLLIVRQLFSCNYQGKIGSVINSIGTCLKVYLVIPKLNGTQMFYKKLLEENKGKEILDKGVQFIQSYFQATSPTNQSSN